MTDGTRSGLDAFAEELETKRRYACTVCRLRDERPELYAEVAAGRQRKPPHPYPRISSYLLARHGLRVTANMVRDHFLLNHEERFR